MAQPLNISLKVSGLDQAKRDLADFASVGKRSFDELAAEARQMSAEAANTDKALAGVATRVRRMAADMDPLAAANIKLRNSLIDVDRAQKAGLITSQQAEQMALKLRTANDNLAQSNTRVTTSANQTRGALTNLSFQVNDVVSSIASGANPMQVFAQQSGQIFQIWQQSPGVFSAAARSITAMITPMRALAAGLAAVGVGFAVMLARSVSLEAQARQVNVVLRAMGTSALFDGKQFQDAANRLLELGVAAEEARAGLLALIRTPGLDPRFAERIVAAGAGLAVIRGGDPVALATELGQALAGGTEAAITAGLKLNAITLDQARAIRAVGDQTKALRLALELIEQQTLPALRDGTSQWTQQINRLSAAWERTRNAFAESAPFKATISALEAMAVQIERIVRNEQQFKNTLTGAGIGVVGGAVAGAAAGAAGGPVGAVGGAIIGGTAGAIYGATAVPTGTRPDDIVRPGAANVFDPARVQLNTEALQRLGTVLDAAVKHLPEGFAVVATSGQGARPGTPGSLHPEGEAIDVRIVGPQGPIAGTGEDVTGFYTRLAIAAFRENQRLFPGTPLAWGGQFGVTPGSTVRDLMHFDTGPERGTLGPPLSQLAGAAPPPPPAPAAAPAAPAPPPAGPAVGGADAAARNEIEKQLALVKQLNEVNRTMLGESQVYWREYFQAIGGGTPTLEQHYDAERRAGLAVEARRIELDKAAATQDRTNQLALQTANAYGVDVVQGLQAAARAQAELRVRAGEAGDVGAETARILQTEYAGAATAAAQALPALRQTTEASERQARAVAEGAKSEHDAEIQMKVSAATQELLNKAKAAGIAVNQGIVKTITAETEALLKRDAAAKLSIQFTRANVQDRAQIETVQLQTALVGQTTEEISRQVALLKVKQEYEAAGSTLSKEELAARTATVNALAAANVQLAEAQREQARINDMVRGIATSIETTLGSAVDDVFSNKKIDDWGTRLKAWAQSILSDFVKFSFIRPAIGTGLQALGFGQVAQQFGSLGGGGTAAGTPVVDSSGSVIGTLGQGASIAGAASNTGLLGELGLGGLSTSISGLTASVNSFGTSLGFAALPGAGVGGIPLAAPGIFGATTLTGFLGAAGVGFGAGTLLSSVIGGNKTGGMIGSGVGSLAGAAIGAAIGMPFLGAILGGLAGGGLGSPLGNRRPGRTSAGTYLDLEAMA